MASKLIVLMENIHCNSDICEDTKQLRHAEYLFGKYIDYRAKSFIFLPVAWFIMRKIKKIDDEYFKERFQTMIRNLGIQKVNRGGRFYFQTYKLLQQNHKRLSEPPPQEVIDALV